MVWVLGLAAALLLLGRQMRVSAGAQAAVLGVLVLAVLAIHLSLPDGHPLRAATGGGLANWGILAGLATLAAVYVVGLRVLRRRATPAALAAPATPPAGSFTPEELERYARHIVLREIGGPGQKRLRAAKVLVIGAGGLGSPALLYLAAAGVGTIGVIDDDTVSLSNLQRQIIHTDDRQGMAKVFSAETAMRAINPHVAVKPYNRRLTAEIARDLITEYDLVVEGTDNMAARYLANAACVAAGVPFLSAAITQWEGQIGLYDPARGAPCYACVFPQAPAPGLAPSCAEAGVIGALPGVLGAMLALEAVKEITGAGESLRGRLVIHDALHGESRTMRVGPRPGCAVCGGRAAAGAAG